MPTPIGHSLAGLAVHLAGGARSPRHAVYALGLVVAANLPDIDFLPGYLTGSPRAFHWGPTHSITAAVLVALAAGLIARRLGRRFAPAFVLVGIAYGSHLLLDMSIGHIFTPSSGLQVFWPFSPGRHLLPWPVFLTAPPGRAPLDTLFSSAAIPLILRELLVLGPVVACAWVWRWLRRERPRLVEQES